MKYITITFLAVCLVLAGCSNVVRIRSEMAHGWAKYSTTLKGYLRLPEGKGPFPVVIIMHGCSGLTRKAMSAQYSLSLFLNRNGFATLILDSFGPRYKGGGMVCDNIEAFAAVRYRTNDAYAALNYLKSQPFADSDNIFLVGQSHGGSVAINVASEIPAEFDPNSKFRALAAYYPWCGPWGMPETLISPLLIFLAEDDDWCPVFSCHYDSWAVTGAEREYEIYPNAHHSFDIPGPLRSYKGHTLAYDGKAAADSRKKMVAFFKKHLK